MKNIKKEKLVKIPGKVKKTLSLKEKLNNIYSNDVNLETTCSHTCTCCKTAMPQINYCEFMNLFVPLWERSNKEDRLNIIVKCIEYFFRYEFEKWGKEIFVKPCLMLKNNMCLEYESRPLGCRLYGLWPEKMYKERVEKFEKAYKDLIDIKDIPLNTQCPNVKRKDSSVEITEEVIEKLYSKLDNLDKKMEGFSDLQIKNKENYRTFHDWILWKFLGEDALVFLTKFMLGATKEVLLSQTQIFIDVWRESILNFKPKVENDKLKLAE